MASVDLAKQALLTAQAIQQDIDRILHRKTGSIAQDWPLADLFAFYRVDGQCNGQLHHFVVYAKEWEEARQKAKAHCKAQGWGRLTKIKAWRMFYRDSDDVQLIGVEG